MRLLVGTDKGLVVFNLDENGIKLEKIHFVGLPVGVVQVDSRNESWWVAINHKHWGPKLHFSNNQGQSWETVESPKFPFDESVRSIWMIGNSKSQEEGSFFVGVEPAALFKTTDHGQTFSLVEGLWNHPSRPLWEGGGKGSMAPFLHTLIVDPEDSERLLVGISCAGVFESTNGGSSWKALNEGLPADFLPNPSAEVGQDPHCIVMSSQNKEVIWQQNHCGIFKTENGGRSWLNVSDKNGMASYGFALALDEQDDSRAWVIPCESDSVRLPVANALKVYVTEDGGQHWRSSSEGLPQLGSFDIVLRQAFAISGETLAFGTNNGNLYYSQDYGKHWQVASNNLSTVRSVVLLP